MQPTQRRLLLWRLSVAAIAMAMTALIAVASMLDRPTDGRDDRPVAGAPQGLNQQTSR